MTHHEAISIWKDSADDALMSEVVGLQTGSSQMIPTGCFVQPKTASECCTLVQGQLRLSSLRQKSLVKLKDPTAQGHVHMSCSHHVLR